MSSSKQLLNKESKLTKHIQKLLIDDLPKKELNQIITQINSIEKPKKPMKLTCKLKINPTLEQKEVLWALAENCRLLYNYGLAERLDWWGRNKELPIKEREQPITFKSQSKQLPELKKQFSRYKQNYSKTLQQTLKRLAEDFKSFFTLRRNGHLEANLPRFKGKNYFTTLHYNQIGFEIEGNSIAFTHFYPEKGKEKIKLEFTFSEKFDFSKKVVKHIDIFQNHKTKEFFIAVVYEPEIPAYVGNRRFQAIDQGVTNIIAAVNSHAGKTLTIKSPKTNNYWQPKINEVKAKQAHCKRYSNRWYWYDKKLKQMIAKEKNQRRDFQHKLAKKIVENTRVKTIIIGDLSTKRMSKRNEVNNKKWERTLRRNMQNSGVINQFAGFLSYKARKVGKKVIRISERNSSKRCCYCGKKEERPLYERTIKCDCGLEIDRDINAAVNILQRFFAVLSLSQKRLVTRQQLLKGFREKFFVRNNLEIRLPS